MFSSETYFLLQLPVLVLCHGLTTGDLASQYFLRQRPMSWNKSREFCQRHYVDLAVLSTEEEYFHILNYTATEKVNFWLGLSRDEDYRWTWVDGEALHYQQWLEKSVGSCGSLEAMLKKKNKMLSRLCNELHAFVCQGPMSPQTVSVVSGSEYVILSWNISAFMQTTPNNYKATRCSSTCDTILYPYTKGSDSISIHIFNLTSATDYSFEISASVIRPDDETRGKRILQGAPTTLLIKTDHGAEIINGKEVIPHSMPYMALLVKNNTLVCGGILIDSKWVLTAAHCDKIQKVLLGVHNIKEKEQKSRQIRKVETSVPHPCFDKDEKTNDLMLLKLDKAVQETKTVKIQPLDKNLTYPASRSTCLVAGWGDTKYNSLTGSDVLMAVNVTVIDRAKCNSKNYYNLNPFITKGQICAGSDGKKRADSCSGDSGGPLLCDGKVVGVTSFGVECGLPKKPGVYSFLSKKQLDWIRNTMKKS